MASETHEKEEQTHITATNGHTVIWYCHSRNDYQLYMYKSLADDIQIVHHNCFLVRYFYSICFAPNSLNFSNMRDSSVGSHFFFIGRFFFFFARLFSNFLALISLIREIESFVFNQTAMRIRKINVLSRVWVCAYGTVFWSHSLRFLLTQGIDSNCLVSCLGECFLS